MSRVSFRELRDAERALAALADREWEAEKKDSGPVIGAVRHAISEARSQLWEAMKERALDEALDASKGAP